MLTNADITLYNKYYDSTAKVNVYLRTVVLKVQWEDRKAANVIKSGGKLSVDKAVVYIPFASGPTYLKPKEWLALALVDRVNFFTLQIDDIIVKGIVTDILSPGFTPTDLIEKYDDVDVISSVDTMDTGSARLHHWQVGAK